MPVGAFFWYCGETYFTNDTKSYRLPEGVLECYGNNVSRTEYAELFAVIGTMFGAGDGSTTFTLPKINKYITAGWNSSSAPDDTGRITEAGLPNITGTMTNLLTYVKSTSGAFTRAVHSAAEPSYTNTAKNCTNITFDASKSNAIYGKSSTVTPPTIHLCPCIVAKSNSFVTYCFRRVL